MLGLSDNDDDRLNLMSSAIERSCPTKKSVAKAVESATR